MCFKIAPSLYVHINEGLNKWGTETNLSFCFEHWLFICSSGSENLFESSASTIESNDRMGMECGNGYYKSGVKITNQTENVAEISGKILLYSCHGLFAYAV